MTLRPRSSPRSGRPATARTTPRRSEPPRASRPRRRSSRSSARAGCSTSSRSSAHAAENLEMVADSVRFLVERGRESSTTPSTSSTATATTATTRCRRSGPRGAAGARTLVLCDTNGGTLTDDCSRSSADFRVRARGATGAAPRPSPGGSTPITTRSWRSPTRWPRSRTVSVTSRPRSTATASAAATRTWSASSPTSRSRPTRVVPGRRRRRSRA